MHTNKPLAEARILDPEILVKQNSAQGIDGFTVKFLTVFWPSLKELIIRGINHMKAKGKLTFTLRRALVKLLQKI